MATRKPNSIVPGPAFQPTGEIAGYPVRPGLYDCNGAMELPFGVNFTIHTSGGTGCELLLYHRGGKEPFAVLPFPEAFRIGDVYSMIVFGLDIETFEYAYRIDGPWDPKKGLLFDKNNILIDPYSRAVTGQHTWGQAKDNRYHSRVVRDTFDWGDMPQSDRPMSDLIIYELHIRNYTQHPTSGVKSPGTFAGLREKIPYLKDLGINAVELMPIFEFDETMNAREVNGKRLLECWGYNTVSFFAPNTSYAAREYHYEGYELKELIRDLHENGIEVILDVVFNHTAEGNEKGYSFCFKGLDNNIYYMLTPDGNYYNFSGCGNTLNCNHPVVQQMILECLRYWTVNYRIDGFRFDLASILGRSEDGSPMNNPPLLKSLAFDPILSRVKLIAEAWDAGGLYQVGSFPASGRWAEWNGRYRDSLRSFLKGDCGVTRAAADSVAGSHDLYEVDDYNGYNSSVNFLTCHDGFTLYDLYSYNTKHNLENGWDNTDGDNNNHSWNCGIEGDTDDPAIEALRQRLMRNACAVLLCSRGTPMLLSGDEFAHTQKGNNNCYCQDNDLSWLNWSEIEKHRTLHDFFRFMIHYRMKHPAIRKELPRAVCGMEPLQIHASDPRRVNITDEDHFFGVSFAGFDQDRKQDDVVYIAINSFWEPVNITLPHLNHPMAWYLSVNTAGDAQGRYTYPEGKEPRVAKDFVMQPRSVAVFTGREHR